MEHRVRFDVDDDVKIAGRPAAGSVFTSPCSRRRCPSAMPAGMRTVTRTLALDQAGAAAGRAWRANDLARAPAVAARPRDDEEALLIAQLARAAALRARFFDVPGAVPKAIAGFARLFAWNLDRGFGARKRFFERDLEVVAQIGAARRTGATAAAAEAEEVAEDVREVAERFGIEATTAGARDAGHAEPVVPRAFLGVAEHGIRLGGFLEFFFGGGVALIAVRMMLEREFAIGALDVLVACAAGDAQNLVVVLLLHAFATLTRAGRKRREPSR
jgi:hypothetical protein